MRRRSRRSGRGADARARDRGAARVCGADRGGPPRRGRRPGPGPRSAVTVAGARPLASAARAGAGRCRRRVDARAGGRILGHRHRRGRRCCPPRSRRRWPCRPRPAVAVAGPVGLRFARSRRERAFAAGLPDGARADRGGAPWRRHGRGRHRTARGRERRGRARRAARARTHTARAAARRRPRRLAGGARRARSARRGRRAVGGGGDGGPRRRCHRRARVVAPAPARRDRRGAIPVGPGSVVGGGRRCRAARLPRLLGHGGSARRSPRCSTPASGGSVSWSVSDLEALAGLWIRHILGSAG